MKNNLTSKEYWEKREAYKLKKGLKDLKKIEKELNNSKFKEFKRDLKSYMKLIEETGDEELLLELNTLSMKSRISRLEEMFYQCGKYINEVYESTNKRLQIAYSSTIKDNN